jgi:hypothetical protein
MATKPLLLLLLCLLSMLMSCTAFGPDGTIPMALHRDMLGLHPQCQMSTKDWLKKCGNDYWRRLSSQQKDCPDECKPPRE